MRSRSHGSRRPLQFLLAAAVGLVPLLAGAPSALAGVGFSAAPGFPSPVAVGNVNVPADFTITNGSNQTEGTGNVTLCAGPTPPGGCAANALPAQSLLLTPACGSTAPTQNCPAAVADPGVFRLSPTGIGLANTACAGVVFTISIADATTGQVVFVPASTVVLGPPPGPNAPAGSPPAVCDIGFTFDVLKTPAKPLPGSGGNTPAQTEQLGFVAGVSNVSGNTGRGFGTNTVTVNKAPIAVTTQVAPTTITLGSTFQDTASLGPVPSGQALPTGSVTFNVYGPADTNCAGAVLMTSTNPVNPGGTAAVSNTFTPASGPGTYRVIATYTGDSSYNAVTSACGAPGEAVLVKAPLPVTTQVSPSALTLGSSFTDTATLGPVPAGQAVPTGTVTFNVYGPTDTNCAGTPVSTSTNAVSAAGTMAVSNAFTPANGPGTYQVIATYNGDANYGVTKSACGAPGEAVTASAPPASPSGPQIAVSKAASPASRPEPGGDFTFTAVVSNPSTTTPVTITKLVDNIYGDLATRAGSTCGTLIGVTLAPGGKSAPCSFTGPFSGKSGASQTDVITVTGVNNGVTVTATAQAVVTLTPATPGQPGALVSPLRLNGPAACVTTAFKAYVTGSSVARITYYVDGKRVGSVTKKDALGHLSITIQPGSLGKGKLHHLTAVVEPVAHSGQPVRTVRRTFAVCGRPTVPRFTG